MNDDDTNKNNVIRSTIQQDKSDAYRDAQMIATSISNSGENELANTPGVTSSSTYNKTTTSALGLKGKGQVLQVDSKKGEKKKVVLGGKTIGTYITKKLMNELNKIFNRPKEYIHTTIIPSDGHLITYSANVKRKKERQMVENAYNNAEFMEFAVIKTRTVDEEDIFESAANVDKSVLKTLEELGIEQGISLLVDKTGITDKALIKKAIQFIFGKTSKIATKLICKLSIILLACSAIDKVKNVKSITDDYIKMGQGEEEHFRQFSALMTARPSNVKKLLKRMKLFIRCNPLRPKISLRTAGYRDMISAANDVLANELSGLFIHVKMELQRVAVFMVKIVGEIL